MLILHSLGKARMEFSETFSIMLCIIVVLYLLWYILIADAEVFLLISEKFRRPVSDYRHKVIWVTGASSGLGEAMAYELSSAGAKLVLTARNKTNLEQVKNKCLELSQGKLSNRDILVLPFDITHMELHKSKVEDVLNHFGQIDVMIHNAGVSQMGPIEDTDILVDESIFDINYFGCINLTKLVLKHFVDRGMGHFVIISSLVVKFPMVPGAAAYCATKCALNGYFETLRTEHCCNNVDVTLVLPGFFRSSFMSNVMSTKKGEVYKNISPTGYEMDVTRCAHLTLVAAVNRLYEAHISSQPILLVETLWGVLPNVFKNILMPMISTRERVHKVIIEKKFPDDLPLWKPFFQ